MKAPRKKAPQSWTVIVFNYNESGSLGPVVSSVREALRWMGIRRWEIVLVDDGSTDGSRQEMVRLARVKGIRAIFHSTNRGIGEALRSGYAAARHENVCAVPADGQFDPLELIPHAWVEPGTFISFFRRERSGYGLFRKLLSAFNRLVNGVFLGIRQRDVNWVKVYKRSDLALLDLGLRSSLVESEICAKLAFLGRECREVPSTYRPRRSGTARGASLKTTFRALRETLKLIGVVWEFKKGQ